MDLLMWICPVRFRLMSKWLIQTPNGFPSISAFDLFPIPKPMSFSLDTLSIHPILWIMWHQRYYWPLLLNSRNQDSHLDWQLKRPFFTNTVDSRSSGALSRSPSYPCWYEKGSKGRSGICRHKRTKDDSVCDNRRGNDLNNVETANNNRKLHWWFFITDLALWGVLYIFIFLYVCMMDSIFAVALYSRHNGWRPRLEHEITWNAVRWQEMAWMMSLRLQREEPWRKGTNRRRAVAASFCSWWMPQRI